MLPYGGVGPDTLRFAVDANLTDAPRVGTLTVAGHTVTVTQLAATDPAGTFDPSLDVVSFYHADAIGSVRMISDAAGQVRERFDYLPFGEVFPASAAFRDRRMFSGHESDQEIGLDYFGARYYGARTGRFTTVDPVMNIEAALKDPQRWNRFSYSLNNPLRYIDPDGAEITTPAGFFTRAFQQHNADNLRALSKVVLNIGRSINSPGHMTPEAEARYFEHPTSREEANRMSLFDIGLTIGGALWGKGTLSKVPALSTVTSIDDVFGAPSVLRGGITPAQLMQRLGTLPETWRVETLGKGSKEGAGWMLREYTRTGNPTGRQIRWHPGRGHHGRDPYWRIIDYNDKSGIIQ